MKGSCWGRDLDYRSCEQGAVLLILELIATVLVVIAGLAIDSTILAASRAEQHHTAEHVALAALAEFGANSGEPMDKLDAARDRAQEIAGVNIFFGHRFSEASSGLDDIGTNRSGDLGANGTIIPGVWHFVPPEDTESCSTPCPCNNGTEKAWVGPCFEPLDFDDETERGVIPNAFRVELFLPEESPVQSLFAKATGEKNFYFRSEATAAVVPSHGVFLIPLSRSSHEETHLAYERNGGDLTNDSSESAFKLISYNGTDSLSCSEGNDNPCASAGDCSFQGGVMPGFYDFLFNYPFALNGFTARPTDGTGDSEPTEHYRSDYKCYSLDYTENGEEKSQKYLVDTYRGDTPSGGTYRGPEPLMTYLDAVHYGLDLIADRKVHGDMIGAIGFDQSARIDIRRFTPQAPGETNFQDLLAITDTSDENQTNKRIKDHMFFPRADARQDLPEALREALAMLNALPGASSSENFVVLLGNGLSSCDGDGNCGLAEEDFETAIQDAVDVVVNDYAPKQVRFHALLSGNYVRPHTLLYPSPQSGFTTCMEDDEARSLGLDFINYSTGSDPIGEALLNPDVGSREARFFHYSNRLYQAVKESDGVWGPIRACCDASCTDVRSSINSACAGATPPEEGNPLTTLSAGSYTDSSGRLHCEAAGRSRFEQYQEYLQEVLSRKPYVLVN